MASMATLGQTLRGHPGHYPEGVAKQVAGHARRRPRPPAPGVARGPAV